MNMKEVKRKCWKKDEVKKEMTFIHYCRRSLSMYVAYPFILLKIPPNAITNLMTFVGIASALSFLTGRYWMGILGIILYHLYQFMDCLDGNVARYWKKTSLKGIYLDSLSHTIVHPAMHICMGYGTFIKTGSIVFLYIGIIIAFLLISTQGLKNARYWILTSHNIKDNNMVTTTHYKGKEQSIVSLLKKTYVSLYDNRMNFLIIFVVINRIEWFLIGFLAFVFVRFILFAYFYSKFDEDSKGE